MGPILSRSIRGVGGPDSNTHIALDGRGVSFNESKLAVCFFEYLVYSNITL